MAKVEGMQLSEKGLEGDPERSIRCRREQNGALLPHFGDSQCFDPALIEAFRTVSLVLRSSKAIHKTAGSVKPWFWHTTNPDPHGFARWLSCFVAIVVARSISYPHLQSSVLCQCLTPKEPPPPRTNLQGGSLALWWRVIRERSDSVMRGLRTPSQADRRGGRRSLERPILYSDGSARLQSAGGTTQ
jgi:hypothetical protein